jgi:hypothetical protein
VKPTRRLLAGLAALLTVCVVATGCDSSPFAASINGQVIKQTALNAELRQLAGNPYYLALAKAGQGVFPKPVTVAGVSSGTYNSTWTAGVLTDIAIGSVVHQHLERTGRLPGAAQYDATRAVDSILYGVGAWGRFSPSFRSTLVGRDADLAMVEPNLLTAAQVSAVEANYSTQLFSNVCVRQIAVDVNTPSGAVDDAASLAQAKAIVAQITASPSAPVGGAVTCYTAAEFETLSLNFVLGILNLKTGAAAAPVKTADGYEVTAVTSRTQIPAGTPLALAYSVALNQTRGQTAQVISGLLAPAHVKVNPLYGTWTGGGKQSFGITPPAVPASSSAPS